MKITDCIKNSKGPLISFEILPPKKGENIQRIWEVLDPLMEFKPPFIDVTYHREEFFLRPRKDGGFDKIATRKRPGTVGICAAIKHRYDVEPVPHIICAGFTKEETENALIDLNFLGIDNVLIIRGDGLPEEKKFKARPNGNNYAIDLVNQVMELNQGVYLDETLQNPYPTNFCIGVAGYPEKHFEAPNKKLDLHFLKQKIDQGADYIVTQMFFDNQKYFDFVDACRNAGIAVPIIPGLKPLTTKSQVTNLPRNFNIDLPEGLIDEVLKCKDNKAVKEVGTEWCIQQSKELIQNGVPVLHYYTMSRSTPVDRIARAVL